MSTSTVSPVLTDEQTLDEVINCLAKHIPINTQGNCDQRTIFEILIHATSNRDSIENTCKTLQDAPCGNDIRYHLEKYNNVEVLELQLNNALQDRLPPRIYKSTQCIATDLNLIAYYGKPTPIEEPYIYRSKAKDGTCSFYAYATFYVIRKNKRVTIAITSVRSTDTTIAVITRLLDKIHTLDLKIKRLYLECVDDTSEDSEEFTISVQEEYCSSKSKGRGSESGVGACWQGRSTKPSLEQIKLNSEV